MRVIILAFLMLFFTNLFAVEASFPRTPTLSPDGKRITFSYGGDIWLVPDSGGQAIRLTKKGYNYRPRWSPNGEYIAFNSDRNGNSDIYILSINDGFLEQLTFYTGDDVLQGWDPRTGDILFTSVREQTHLGPLPYRIKLSGGNPEPVLEFVVSGISISNEGLIAFTRGHYSWWRKGYRGPFSGDIWISDGYSIYLIFGEHTDYNDGYPMWADTGTLYLLSDRDGTSNIFRYSIITGDLQQLTYFEDDGVRFPSINFMGDKIAFEREFGIYILDTQTLEITTVKVDVLEEKLDDVWLTECSGITEFDVSNGAIAFVLRGDLYIADTSGGKARRVTESQGRVRNINFVEDGEALFFASDKDGDYDIYILQSSDPDEERLYLSLDLKEENVISSPFDEYAPTVSPDGEKLAFIMKRGKLMVYNLKTKKERLLAEQWSISEYNWSPDSRWIAYRSREYINDIYIVNVKTGESFNISKHPRPDILPSWSDDGRIIAFSSDRKDDDYDIWWSYLRKEDDEKTEEDWKREKLIEEKDSIPDVKIDFEDIDKRAKEGTDLPGDAMIFAIAPESDRFIFRSDHTGKEDLYIIDKENENLKPLTTGGKNPAQVVLDEDKIYYLSKGKIWMTDMDGREQKSIGFNIKERIDIEHEREQIFHEVWRTLKNDFYDENFHGVDWDSMYNKYREMALSVNHPYEFRSAIRLMLGEINSSHLSIYKKENSQLPSTGILGVIWDYEYKGEGLRIKRVIKDSPAYRRDSRLYEGDIILSIDGIDIGKNNISEIMEGKTDELVRLRVLNEIGKERIVNIRPVEMNEVNGCLYEEWVDFRREIVDELSDGRFGYIHIPHMGWKSVDNFQQELYKQGLGKDGMVIDVRYNSGGWIADHLLVMLDTRVHAYTVRRDGEPGYPISERLPYYVWTKPSIVLINERTFSNGEIFAHAYKTLGLGKLVGNTTNGSVISTHTRTLRDGTKFTVPGRGWYTAYDEINLEGGGAVPDYIVYNPPEEDTGDSDNQLKKAVELLLETISSE